MGAQQLHRRRGRFKNARARREGKWARASPVQLALAVAPVPAVVLPFVHGLHAMLGCATVPPDDQVPRSQTAHGEPPLPRGHPAANVRPRGSSE